MLIFTSVLLLLALVTLGISIYFIIYSHITDLKEINSSYLLPFICSTICIRFSFYLFLLSMHRNTYYFMFLFDYCYWTIYYPVIFYQILNKLTSLSVGDYATTFHIDIIIFNVIIIYSHFSFNPLKTETAYIFTFSTTNYESHFYFNSFHKSLIVAIVI